MPDDAKTVSDHDQEAAASVLRLALCYTQDQILTDWWPETAEPTPQRETDQTP
ncbi:MAG: hypothetical protein AB7F35_06615 [Acetobacteraceae bacterium]